MQILDRITKGETPNAIAPFLWLHGEEESVLRAEVRRIHDCGIGALCAEARPHKDFNGPGWFRDLGILLDECKRLGMEMWVLDDSHFPTGYADGAVKKNHPDLRKRFLCCKTLDYAGPQPHSGAVLKYALRDPQDEILGVYLCPNTGFEEMDTRTVVDLTGKVEWVEDYNTGKPTCDWKGQPIPGALAQGRCPIVRFDLPAGSWSLNVLTLSYKGGEKQTEGYLNPLDPRATQVLLDTVYQPIFDHFGAEFGKTLQGFFSDEPRFGNIHGAEGASIGRNSEMVLPWRPGLEELLAAELKGTVLENRPLGPLLPLLFVNGTPGEPDTHAHVLRHAYMQLVSRLYSENFDGVLGRWCHDHGCRHIGHTIEDNNAHSRLGYGAGHFFRAMAHQDMAGIDVVIQQLTPGQDRGLFKGMHSPGWDGEFFTYVLGKLGGSMGHLNPAAGGRCMCELFGAYSWAEGNRLCKWLADYMLVRGVNYFVPHAFDPAPFPDADCPPHFYAHGKNPQYPEFGLLMGYMNRMAALLAGRHIAPVALLYHAEAEWSGDYMLTQKPAACLARHGVDYDIVPADYLAGADADAGSLRINGESFRTLVIPYAEALPAALLRQVRCWLDRGLPVYFVQDLPRRTSEGTPMPDLTGAEVVALEELVPALTRAGIPELTLSDPAPYLRYYHARQADGDVYFFFNEGTLPLHTRVTGAKAGAALVYDPFGNAPVSDADPFLLDLPAFGTKCVLVPDAPLPQPAPDPFAGKLCRRELAPGTVCFADAENPEVYGEPRPLESWLPVDTLPGMAAFAGRIRYRLDLCLTAEEASRPARLVLTGVQEGARVTVNGQLCGVRIGAPYIYPLGRTLRPGSNEILLEVNTTLGRRMNDFTAQYLPMEPLGITGGAVLEWPADQTEKGDLQ